MFFGGISSIGGLIVTGCSWNCRASAWNTSFRRAGRVKAADRSGIFTAFWRRETGVVYSVVDWLQGQGQLRRQGFLSNPHLGARRNYLLWPFYVTTHFCFRYPCLLRLRAARIQGAPSPVRQETGSASPSPGTSAARCWKQMGMEPGGISTYWMGPFRMRLPIS